MDAFLIVQMAVGQYIGRQPLIGPLIWRELCGHLMVGLISHENSIDLLDKLVIAAVLLTIGCPFQPVHPSLAVCDETV